ncbi:restriction endonuclease subunit S [Parafannyhessea umbonata]|uniref:Type I restriction modification DNA specificity domain-containing protein n=1 Tax=Parafannyhessea umbonata TaxID=604330 RepID=A0A1G6MQK2_9ACTN|nr:Type I restriction modification DNA specificity domain-containing protein [Parafannyhessea umbonata]
MGSSDQQLQDICQLIVDCPHSSAKDEGAGYPLIRTPNVGRGRLILNGVQRVSRSVYLERVSRAVPRQGDLILAREAPAGNVAIIDSDYPVCLGQRTMLLRPDNNLVNPYFLVYYLNAPEQRARLLRLSNGATVPHVNVADVRAFPVHLPTRARQDRIASVIKPIDDILTLHACTGSVNSLSHFRQPGSRPSRRS